jgi:hypothetical protein
VSSLAAKLFEAIGASRQSKTKRSIPFQAKNQKKHFSDD